MCPTFKPAPSLDAPQVGLLRADSLRSRKRSAPICSSRTKPFDPSQAQASFDLLISLYAGPIWEHCRQYLSPQGLLLANTSHGDASIAALDPALRLVAAVHHRADKYRLDTADLDSYLIPKRPSAADPDTIRRQGRGIAYTKTAFAYVFELVGNHC